MLGIEEIKRYDKVYLFGTAWYGEVILKKFLQAGVNVVAFCSSYGDQTTYLGYPVIAPQDLPNEDTSLIVISSMWAKQISSILDTLGIKNYVDGVLYALEDFCGGSWTDHFLPEHISYLEQQREIIRSIVDSQSLKIYDSLIEYKKRQKASSLVTSDYKMYIHPKISLKDGCIVDCGAFTGDTLNLFKKEFPSATYVGIEPSVANYRELTAIADEKDLLYSSR